MLDNVYKTTARFVQHIQQQKQSIVQYKDEVGASAADITEIVSDTDVAEFLLDITNQANEFKETAFGIKSRFFSTKTEPPAGEFMIAPDTTPPTPIVAGAIKRSRERDQRFLHAVGITEAARIALDLIGDTPSDISPETVKPTTDARAASTGYEFALIVGNRQKSDMYDVFVIRSGNSTREKIASGTGKSVNIVITPTEPGKAEQLLVIVQLKKNNKNYGLPSDPIYVTVNP